MSDVSRLIRERALAILRDTRAKIDPALLSAMKDHIQKTMPGAEISFDADMPLSAKAGKSTEKAFVPPPMPEPLSVPDTHEAVDKQKIAQIVLQYMKHRDGGRPH